MRKGASADGRANPLKTRCRVSSRSTLPCFLLEQDLALRGSRGQPPGVSTKSTSGHPPSEVGKPGVKQNPRPPLANGPQKPRYSSKIDRSRRARAIHPSDILTTLPKI